LKLDETERAKYERREENRRYKESLFYTAEIRGEKRGMKKEKIAIAKSSLEQNIDISTIALITGLSVEEIERLR
jgi:predicted transposase/invertase (TIGR01784 family)